MTTTSMPMLERGMNRRQFLRGIAGASALLLAPSLLRTSAGTAFAAAPARSVALANLHTGEACNVTYFESGRYVPEALASIDHIMRDHRNGETLQMDTDLLDLLTMLHSQLGTDQPFEVVSGYRSPQTNAALHARSSGVAKHSLHMEGKAVDIRITGRSLTGIRQTALAMGLGGVGYYPTSNFVHVDTGKVRQWVGA